MKRIATLITPALIALVCFSTSAMARCTEELGAHEPKHQPLNWIADFSYKENPVVYFKQHYEAASKENFDLYAFFYADWCKPCVRFRKDIIRHQSLQEVFKSSRVVMFEIGQFNCLTKELTGEYSPVIEFIPMLVKVRSDGSLGHGIDPDKWYGKPRSVTITGLERFMRKDDDT